MKLCTFERICTREDMAVLFSKGLSKTDSRKLPSVPNSLSELKRNRHNLMVAPFDDAIGQAVFEEFRTQRFLFGEITEADVPGQR